MQSMRCFFIQDLIKIVIPIYQYQLRYHELLRQESTSFIWCITECMNLNGTE